MIHDDFLKKSTEFLEEAKDSLVKERFNAAAFLAAQSAINANDALTLKFLSKRATKDHKDALKLNKQVVTKLNDSKGRSYLRELLDAIRIYGYSEKRCSKSEATRLIKNAQKFESWVRGLVKK